MKKLMIALVAVAFGCAAQAAVVKWSSNDYYKQVSAADGTMAGANCGNTYSILLTIVGDGGHEVTSTGSWNMGKLKATTVDNDYLTLGQTYSYTLVVSGTVTDNSKNYADYIGKEATVTITGSFTMNDQGETTLSIAPTGYKWDVASVPEPTSGLLLLLGVAGLALKRRRA